MAFHYAKGLIIVLSYIFASQRRFMPVIQVAYLRMNIILNATSQLKLSLN